MRSRCLRSQRVHESGPSKRLCVNQTWQSLNAMNPRPATASFFPSTHIINNNAYQCAYAHFCVKDLLLPSTICVVVRKGCHENICFSLEILVDKLIFCWRSLFLCIYSSVPWAAVVMSPCFLDRYLQKCSFPVPQILKLCCLKLVQ